MKEMGIRSTQIIEAEINIHTVLKGYLDAFSYVMGSAAPVRNSDG
jgi:hypothetical protein